MATLSLALLGFALAASPAAAGEPLGTDLFGGYSYLKLDDVSRHGADLALGFRAFGPVAGFVDTSTHWGGDSGLSFNDLTLMAGPGVRFGKRAARSSSCARSRGWCATRPRSARSTWTSPSALAASACWRAAAWTFA